MGVSTDAILAYGYDLGGEDAGWKIKGLNEYGELVFPWYNDEVPFFDVIEGRLAAEHAAVRDSGYVDDRALKERAGVEFVMYQHIDFHAYILATTYVEVHRGHSKRIESLDVPEGSDEKLRAAVEAIGIEPIEGPGWYLVSYWG